MNKAQRDDLLQQMLETETGGVKIYETALQCVQNEDLKEEWEKYLEQTTNHLKIVQELMAELGVEAKETPSRKVVRHIGESLVKAMTMARQSDAPKEAAEIVACECVILAET
ncbi:MAG: DUF892 family protein, partial [Reyranellaceae bacterium]